MEYSAHKENVVRYRKLIAITEDNPSRDETRYRALLLLLAEEMKKQVEPHDD